MGQLKLTLGKAKEVFWESVKKRTRMTNLVLAFAVVSFVVTGSLAHPGGATRNKCPPKPPTIQEFNATEYLGIWYEQRRFPAFFQLNTRCVRAERGNEVKREPGHNPWVGLCARSRTSWRAPCPVPWKPRGLVLDLGD